MRLYLSGFLFLVATSTFAQSLIPYKDATVPIEVRVKDLLARMTPAEKFWQLFMCPGDLSVIDDTTTSHGIFGLQVSASSQGGGGQMLNYNTTQGAKLLAQ